MMTRTLTRVTEFGNMTLGWEHRKQKFRTFLSCGSDSGQFDCGERYSKRKRTQAKREQKHTYTNPIFQHVFVIFCERVCKNYFCYLEYK